MSITLTSVVVATADPERLARFWADGLGWQALHATATEATVARSPDEPSWGDGGAPRLVFVGGARPPEGRNRIHIDVASSSSEEQRVTVDRLLALGATRIDIGQREVPWEVLADPDGNELCVLEPREAYAGRQGIAAVVIRCRRPRGLAGFWSEVTGWEPHLATDGFVGFSNGAGADLELLAALGDLGGHRVGIGVRLVDGADPDVEVARLEAAGGQRPSPTDVGHAVDEIPADPRPGEARRVVEDREGARVIVGIGDHPCGGRTDA